MIHDFFMSALPLVACGLIMAIVAVFADKTVRNRNNSVDEKASRPTNKLSAGFYIASAMSYVTSVVMWIADGDMSSGLVWMCLGSTSLCLGAAEANKAKRKDEGRENV
ncbi:MAG: hypothetical protein ACI3Y5_02260 [Prevotella sp.]